MLETTRAPVAIVGAGWLGRALAGALACPVIATTRTGQWRGPCPPHVTVHPLDATDPAADWEPVARAPAVVVAFAPGREPGVDAARARDALYVQGTRALLDALAPTCRVVWVGSTSALADHDGWVDESWTAPATTDRGRTQRAAEALVLAHAGRNIVLRMGGLVGPQRELQRIYRLRDPAVPRRGDGMAPTNLVHRDDAVRAITAALARPNVRGIVHVVADGHPPRRLLYAQAAARAATAPPTWSQAPHGGPPRGKRVSNLRLKLALGVRLAHPQP